MQLVLSPQAINDLEFWRKGGHKNILKKIENLVKSILETPFEGIGKPEPLKHELAGYWSRRIDHEHRIIYKATEELITIISLKGHY